MKNRGKWIVLIIIFLFLFVTYNLKQLEHNRLERLGEQKTSYNIAIIKDSKEYFVFSKASVHVFLIEVIVVLIFIIVLLMKNIYKGQKTEVLLRQSKGRYKELLMSIPDSVILIEEKELKFINQFGKRLLGAEEGDEMTYTNLIEILGEGIDFEHIDLLPPQTKVQTNMQIRTMHHETKDVEVTVISRRKQDCYKGVILLIQDVSQGKLLYKSIEREQIRNEFFANLTHEFKTPINLVLTTAQLLEQFKGQEDLQRVLPKSTRILKQNAYRLTRLVNNMIDLTRMGGEDIKLDVHNCNIIELTEDITLSTLKYAKAKGIKLLFDTAVEELEAAVDQDKYERIILNILSNAIKYNKSKGDINVNMYVEERNVVVSIKDTGIGISRDMLPYIFEGFMQVNKSLIRNVEGSGMGLSIVKSLVALHGGKIEVKSKEGEGTEFIVYLPIYKRSDEKGNKGGKLLTTYNDTHTQIELSDIYIDEY